MFIKATLLKMVRRTDNTGLLYTVELHVRIVDSEKANPLYEMYLINGRALDDLLALPTKAEQAKKAASIIKARIALSHISWVMAANPLKEEVLDEAAVKTEFGLTEITQL